MKAKAMLMRALGVTALVLVVGTSVALAHGTPNISAQQTTVAAGGKITLSGDGMGEDGQIVTFSLKGMTFQAQLGTAKLQVDAFDGATFTIPAKAPPGTYLIVGQNGSINASTSIEVTASATTTDAMAATPAATGATTAPMAGAAPVLTRARTPVEWALPIGFVVVAGGLGLFLLTRQLS